MEFNGIDPIGQEDEPRRVFRNHRLRRGIYLLPSALTVANMLCGYYAILATLEGGIFDFDRAACAIGFAYLFDSLDGRIARFMRTESAFGREFDSLADVVSFGIAPAILAYAWGIRSMAAANAPESLHLTQLGWFIGFFFLGCCAWRLARFNIQGMAPGGNRFFVGMPTPAAAGMIAAVVHAFPNPVQDVRVSLLWLLLVLVLGVLMSSTVRYYSFKDIQWTKRRPSLAIILMFLLIGAIVLFSRPTLLLITSAYTVQGVVMHLVRFVRHRTASKPA
ncbi:MAG TPA: CDP-diacylglycerol--serine O-phosphatidyltransferase [Candidatus Limnocylindria bacterium]|nr:CDP-diacylglycerol--serine O-phosphatidyltransferase [Candidatus Limnocylindria bacterium]